MRTIASAITLLLLISSTLEAQSSLTGKWEGKTPNNFDVILELTAKDATLTGTFTRNGESAEITEGNVSKNTFSFKVSLNGQIAGMTGEVEGDQVRIWMDQQGPTRAMTLKRVK